MIADGRDLASNRSRHSRISKFNFHLDLAHLSGGKSCRRRFYRLHEDSKFLAGAMQKPAPVSAALERPEYFTRLETIGILKPLFGRIWRR